MASHEEDMSLFPITVFSEIYPSGLFSLLFVPQCRGFVSQIMLYYWKFRHILLQREKSREAIELASIFLLLFLCC